MILFENSIYWLQFGPLRKSFRFLIRRWLARGNRVLLGPARGCALASKADLPYRLGIYEIQVQRALARVLNRGTVFYDVGANVGFFSLLGGKLVGDSGAVFAFEPSSENGAALLSLCTSNGVRNVELITDAVSAEDGEACFAQGPSHAQFHLANDQGSGGLKVRTVSLDSFTKTHPSPQVVLMDIEGAEFDALRGARHLLSSPTAPSWIIELHRIETEGLVTEMLSSSGYELTTLHPPVARVGRFPIHLLANKPSF